MHVTANRVTSHLRSIVDSSVALGALLLLASAPLRAQTCLQLGPSLGAGSSIRGVAHGDLDGDGDLDLVTANQASSSVSVLLNQGGGVFAPPATYFVGLGTKDVACADLDRDGDVDVAVGHNNVSVLVNQGPATFTVQVVVFSNLFVNDILANDLDGDGDADLVTANSQSGSITVLRNSGPGIVLTSTTYPFATSPVSIVSADFDGDGDQDLAAASNSSPTYPHRVWLNQGGAIFTVLSTTNNPDAYWPLTPFDADADGDVDLLAPDLFQGGIVLFLNAGTGLFAAPSAFGISVTPNQVLIADVDRDGLADLACPSDPSEVTVFLNLGAGSFSAPSLHQLPDVVSIGTAADLDGDGAVDLAIAADALATVYLLFNCTAPGQPFCPGDGSGTPCPCGNHSPSPAPAGCLHSQGTGATLRASGVPRVTSDTLVLQAASMPNGTAVFLQGDARMSGGAGAVLGDGKLCISGNLIRIGTRSIVGGASSYPGPGGGAPVSVRGHVTPGSVHTYQVWYRNAVSFCTPETYNLSNGFQLLWSP